MRTFTTIHNQEQERYGKQKNALLLLDRAFRAPNFGHLSNLCVHATAYTKYTFLNKGVRRA
jgi:hypothetical protein